MDIPIPIQCVPKDDPLSKSIIYTFPESSKSIDKEGNTLLRFPYSENTYWTAFKYMPLDYTSSLDIEIILITNDGYTYTISPLNRRAIDTWHDTTWAIPSIRVREHTGIFLRIHGSFEHLKGFRFNLLGFMDLYPATENYILMSEFDTYQFIFNNCGSIYNVEHPDYIRGIIDSAVKISTF